MSSPQAEPQITSTTSISDEGSPKETKNAENENEELVSIPKDTYNMVLVSTIPSQAFCYAAYVFVLKMVVYSLLAIDTVPDPLPEEVDTKVRVAQFLMLPVAVAMQQDLIGSYYLIANIKFAAEFKKDNPAATEVKFKIVNLFRCIDGAYSLFINFVILLHAEEVLSLFLNFAALQFLQQIDDIALTMARDGYLTERLEVTARKVEKAELPKQRNPIVRLLDSFLLVATVLALFLASLIISVQ